MELNANKGTQINDTYDWHFGHSYVQSAYVLITVEIFAGINMNQCRIT